MRIILITLVINLLISTNINAKIASVIGDPTTGKVFFEVNKDTRNYPASLTKMMTLYIIFDYLTDSKISMNDYVKFSNYAASQSPSKLNIAVGDSIKVSELINGLIIKSGNDAAIAIAEKISGSEKKFVSLMNSYAKKLKMTNTNFANPNGLPNNSNLSSAYDMFLLGSALYNDYPEYRKHFNKTSTVINGIKYRTHNKLVAKYKYYKGLKTGYIYKSGFQIALLGIFNDRPLLGIYFGGNSAKERNDKIHYLMNKVAKDFYSNKNLNKIKNESTKKNKLINVKLNSKTLYTVQTSSFTNIKKSKLFILSLLKNKKLNEIKVLMHNIEKRGRYFITITEPINRNYAEKICNIIKNNKLDCIVKRF
ncbi:D-alanyl-D-alanine carboxypeptidase [Alphaproteobacteria bacterium]|nr:D-alanyl-D-alanine carboxypeptidase [Alphaproteobacteria bacterium]